MTHRLHRRLLLGVFVLGLAARAETNAPIRVLVVDGFSNHDWQRTTALVKGVLAPTRRFAIDVATCPAKLDDPAFAFFRPRFADYEVVLLNCNNLMNGSQWPGQVRENFVKFVRDGGGVFVLHSANNSFPNWTDYDRIIGLGWRGKDMGRAISIEHNGSFRYYPPGEGDGTGHGPRTDRVIHRLGEHPCHANGWPR